jgi:hypothetical protein
MKAIFIGMKDEVSNAAFCEGFVLIYKLFNRERVY